MKYYKSCAVCGATSKGTDSEAIFESGNARGHEWSQWMPGEEGTHSRVCARDAGHIETAACTYGDYMMYMKQMPGDELYTLTQEQPWKVAVEKLAEIHLTFWQGECAFETASQQVHGSKPFMTWIQRASEHASFKKKWRVAFDRAIERVHLAPKTLIHGDFFPTNILVDGCDICIIDWADATVFGYMMDVGRLTAIIDKKTLKPMCPCVDKVISAYYNRVKDKLQMDYSEYLQDIHAAHFIELCKYYQPVRAFGIQQEYASLLERRLDSIAEEYLV